MPVLGLSADPPLAAWPTSGVIGILDLEYTAWEGSVQRDWCESWEWREIVQIGFLLVDAGRSFSTRDGLEIMVQPARNPELSDYFIALTGITNERLAGEGRPLADSLEALSAFGASAEAIIFNGYDGEIFRENCTLNNVDLPWDEARMFDFRPLLAKSLDQPAHKLVSSDLPELAGISVSGRAHSALHDCKAIAAALAAWRKAGRL